jgi:hypothetical protein
MADMRFSCPECGQHFSCAKAWAGHQLECPTCQKIITVPNLASRSAPAPPPVPASETAKASGPKLPAGAAHSPRSTAHAPAPTARHKPLPPRSDNSLLKYGLVLVLVAALGGIGYFYGLPLITSALEREPATNPPAGAGAAASQGGARRPGPLGDVNEAMDVSDALDGGSSPRPRPAPVTNTPSRH